MTQRTKSDVNVELDPHGFYVVTPTEAWDITSLCCPVCTVVMRTKEDDVSYHEFQCCERCSMLWAFSHREEWKNGWRPSQEEIDAAEATRSPMIIDLALK